MEKSDCTVKEQIVFTLRSLPAENTKERLGEGVYMKRNSSPQRSRVEKRRVESLRRNEQRPVRKHPASSKHFPNILLLFDRGLGRWRSVKQDKEKAGNERQGHFRMWGRERGSRYEDEGGEKEGGGDEMGCNS